MGEQTPANAVDLKVKPIKGKQDNKAAEKRRIGTFFLKFKFVILLAGKRFNGLLL